MNSNPTPVNSPDAAPLDPIHFSMNAFIRPEMAVKAENVGVKKAVMGWRNTFALAVLAGAFITLGAVFSTTVTAGAASQMPYGSIRLTAGLAFCLGLILVVVAGSATSSAAR